MKTGLLLGLLAIAGINMFLPDQVFFFLMIGLLIMASFSDKAKIYNSSYALLLPFIGLVFIGVVRGADNPNRDFYRDVILFSKTIIYFIAGIALSKYLKNFNTFFKYFLFIAFVSALIHMALIIINIHSISSLESIRYFAGFGNDIEGIIVALMVSRFFNRNLRKLIDLSLIDKLLGAVIVVSFLLYFSRTLIVSVIVLPLFLCNSVNVRKIFSKKNAKILRVPIVIMGLFYTLTLIASFQSTNSPLQTLITKFEQIPQEVGWNAQKNTDATKEDIQANWRGYEAYQGLMKFSQGSTFQKLFGYGFSEKVDLGITIQLAGADYDQVPILHNEYVTLLVKCGIAGLVLYLIFLYGIGFKKVKDIEEHTEIYYCFQMLSALSVISLLNTFTGFGLIGATGATVPIIIGFFQGNIQRQRQEVELPDSKGVYA
jgi:hypothetical protein